MNIVVEGIDASGKTTLINYLSEKLKEKSIKHQVIADVKEPTPLLPVFKELFNTNFLQSNKNFKTSLYETLLFACSHFYVQEQNRNNKHITIYDRDIFTLLSYQKELIRQEYPKNYLKFYKPFKEMLLFENKKIDLLVYVSIPLEENIKRKEARDGIKFSEKERQELKTFKTNMEQEIHEYSQKHNTLKILKLDGRISPAENCKKILQSLESELNNENSFEGDYDQIL